MATDIRVTEVQDQLTTILNQVKEQSNNQCRLVAVSKTKPVEDILAAYQIGQRHFGENIQELVEKAEKLPKDINWHFIGNYSTTIKLLGAIQSNKLKFLASIPNLYVIETLDSFKKAQMLNKLCAERASPLKVFIQVNTSGEECKTIKPLICIAKSGVTADESLVLAQQIISECPNIKLDGLMTIGSFESSHIESEPNPDFEKLKVCRQRIQQQYGLEGLELSMGMSDDFIKAIHQGSTNVRVGSSIFGKRNYNTSA
ncbi:hypothetical protein BC833DRAFT_532328 [Globomyces pollinis-pini]|nr:hypothetical protein BC833DRAFT_532328 [Globomyces pollinis-pini]